LFRVQNCFVGSILKGSIVYVLPPLQTEIFDKNADLPHAIAQVQRIYHSTGKVDIFWLTDGNKESNSKGTFTNGWLLDRIRPIKGCIDLPDLCGLLNRTSPWSRFYTIFDLLLVVEIKGEVRFLTWWKGFSIDESTWLTKFAVQESLNIDTEDFCHLSDIPCVVADGEYELASIKEDFLIIWKENIAKDIPEMGKKPQPQKKRRRKEEKKEFFGHIDKNFHLLSGASKLEAYVNDKAADGLYDENIMYEVPELPLEIPDADDNGY
jgi:hypothetical protein